MRNTGRFTATLPPPVGRQRAHLLKLESISRADQYRDGVPVVGDRRRLPGGADLTGNGSEARAGVND